ncbi:hypothetical protein VOLCADRAFT_107425 [Volvox carteri f. nagariensis]|uniref:Uncharacterized protein n=1 Tax=Volvox carteri f. nagariensis TaxID=3068 RepID=D8UDY7_VOLCA|nr:uncharacterized protein VOLCADRAFT_107425 [Volvox carteri f. nagariensis]EFJ42033.1 hypothetical protein VOLCADRAFT_107425 [Volvox carteri f. nagariensis]|eukprot:XP_002956908.1 hypothetical protein VOLCADRAFT_107425 [Volvox carteri f. nagariensis]
MTMRCRLRGRRSSMQWSMQQRSPLAYFNLICLGFVVHDVTSFVSWLGRVEGEVGVAQASRAVATAAVATVVVVVAAGGVAMEGTPYHQEFLRQRQEDIGKLAQDLVGNNLVGLSTLKQCRMVLHYLDEQNRPLHPNDEPLLGVHISLQLGPQQAFSGRQEFGAIGRELIQLLYNQTNKKRKLWEKDEQHEQVDELQHLPPGHRPWPDLSDIQVLFQIFIYGRTGAYPSLLQLEEKYQSRWRQGYKQCWQEIKYLYNKCIMWTTSQRCCTVVQAAQFWLAVQKREQLSLDQLQHYVKEQELQGELKAIVTPVHPDVYKLPVKGAQKVALRRVLAGEAGEAAAAEQTVPTCQRIPKTASIPEAFLFALSVTNMSAIRLGAVGRLGNVGLTAGWREIQGDVLGAGSVVDVRTSAGYTDQVRRTTCQVTDLVPYPKANYGKQVCGSLNTPSCPTHYDDG